MHKILQLNQIAPKGLQRFPQERYQVAGEISQPDAIIVRSQTVHPDALCPSLKAIARAGTGVNNIPVGLCTTRGIPVFNTPGANANAVKELVLAALVLTSRGIMEGMQYVNGLQCIADPKEINGTVEANKKRFAGQEIAGKTLGVVGLGKIGSLVVDMGLKLGMQVIGFDPELSVDAAWRLSNQTQKIEDLRSLLAKSDYVTLHLPALETTRNMINQETVKSFKPGARLLNFARGEIVETGAIISALESGRLLRYASDFPTPGLIGRADVLLLPHIGASTQEAEEACAMMAADQLVDFLERGNITNAVNFPAVHMDKTSEHRVALSNKNVPGMLQKILAVFADRSINVSEMLSKSRDEIMHTLIDVETTPSEDVLQKLSNIEGVINVRMVF